MLRLACGTLTSKPGPCQAGIDLGRIAGAWIMATKSATDGDGPAVTEADQGQLDR